MECERKNCRARIAPGEERLHHGQVLCDDCYMDALSPPRTCDPWAVRSACLSKELGESSAGEGLQAKILALVRENDGVTREELAATLKARPSDVERELAALRHMEKIRAAMRGTTKVIVPWEET